MNKPTLKPPFVGGISPSESILRGLALIIISALFVWVIEMALQLGGVSFLNREDSIIRAWVAVTAALPIILAAFIFWLIISLVLLAAPRIPAALVWQLLSGCLLAVGLFRLLESIFYGLFSLKVVGSSGCGRLWWTFVMLLCLWAGRSYARLLSSAAARKTALFFSLLSVLAVLHWTPSADNRKPSSIAALRAQKRPHVILLVGDGISASRTSLFGYHRDTTPFLRSNLGSFLAVSDAFPNAPGTGASITSVLTGRHPLTTGLIYYPDILLGADAYRHLPGILGQLGYVNYEASVRMVADSFELNLRNGFDYSNGRSKQAWQAPLAFVLARPGLERQYYLYNRVFSDVTDRLLHVFWLGQARDHYMDIFFDNPRWQRDREKIKLIRTTLSSTASPVFIYVHLMGTHGPSYYLEHRHFSQGPGGAKKYAEDLYDDAVLAFDSYVREVFEFLSEAKLLDNTVVFIFSDHGTSNSFDRVPLLIHLPQDLRPAFIRPRAELIDISPSLLDLLGLEKPEWMEGVSLFDAQADVRPVVFLDNINWLKQSPPWYNLASCGTVVGDTLVTLKLDEGNFAVSPVRGCVTCAQASEEATAEAKRVLSELTRLFAAKMAERSAF